MGWPGFFLLTVAIALPGLVLLKVLRGTIETMEKQGDS
jgi:PAT family beta-lactamase induction signal transducer AmpG